MNQIQPHGGKSGPNLQQIIMGLAMMYIINPIDIPGPIDDTGVLFLAMFLIGVLGMFKGGAQ
jgi:hypothetical protein